MNSSDPDADPAARLINIIRADRPASFHIAQLPAQLQPGVELCVSADPLVEDHIALYILPAERLAGLSAELTRRGRPLMAYGPPELLPIAFDCGCSDYLREPWGLPELKLRALRVLPPRRMHFSWGVVELHRNILVRTSRRTPGPGSRTAEVLLSPPEAALFRLLSAEGGTPVSRECLQCTLERLRAPHAWQRPHGPGPAGAQPKSRRAVDVHISALRKKLNRLAGYQLAPPPIRSIYGYGYQLIHK